MNVSMHGVRPEMSRITTGSGEVRGHIELKESGHRTGTATLFFDSEADIRLMAERLIALADEVAAEAARREKKEKVA